MTTSGKEMIVATPIVATPIVATRVRPPEMCDRERALRSKMADPFDPDPPLLNWMEADRELDNDGSKSGWAEAGKDFLRECAEFGAKCLFVLACIALSWIIFFAPAAKNVIESVRVECREEIKACEKNNLKEHDKRTTAQHDKRTTAPSKKREDQ
jgi:hypothetical protein